MPLMDAETQRQVKEQLAEVTHPVRLVYFTQELECPGCGQTKEILQEIAPLSPLVTLEVHNIQLAKELAASLNIERVPALAVVGDDDRGIRFYGMPSGYEFVSLLEAIKMVGKRDSGLSAEAKLRLAGLKTPVEMEVYVTPTCPYCPGAVVTAFKMAYESPQIKAAMVEAMEFPQLANRYSVRGVPRTVVNQGLHYIEGAVPEMRMVQEVLNSVAA